jgi:hypothetical protein
MLGWISRADLPEDATVDWLFDVFAWLLEETGGYHAFRARAKLVLPTDEFFPVSANLERHDLALALFTAAREHAGLAGRPCKLIPHEEGPAIRDLLGDVPYGESSNERAAGAFHGAAATEGLISYAPSGLRDPEAFVATMAHELGHYIIHSFSGPAPGGEEAREPATDICAIFLGFGVFTANAAFRFEQHQTAFTQGWSYRRLGYLGERPLSYSLAIFLALRGLDVRAVAGKLRDNPYGYVKTALKHLAKERGEELARLQAINGQRLNTAL